MKLHTKMLEGLKAHLTKTLADMPLPTNYFQELKCRDIVMPLMNE
jgi:hypothetical protein